MEEFWYKDEVKMLLGYDTEKNLLDDINEKYKALILKKGRIKYSWKIQQILNNNIFKILN